MNPFSTDPLPLDRKSEQARVTWGAQGKDWRLQLLSVARSQLFPPSESILMDRREMTPRWPDAHPVIVLGEPGSGTTSFVRWLLGLFGSKKTGAMVVDINAARETFAGEDREGGSSACPPILAFPRKETVGKVSNSASTGSARAVLALISLTFSARPELVEGPFQRRSTAS